MWLIFVFSGLCVIINMVLSFLLLTCLVKRIHHVTRSSKQVPRWLAQLLCNMCCGRNIEEHVHDFYQISQSAYMNVPMVNTILTGAKVTGSYPAPPPDAPLNEDDDISEINKGLKIMQEQQAKKKILYESWRQIGQPVDKIFTWLYLTPFVASHFLLAVSNLSWSTLG